jgi:hypothetical protein
MRLEPVLGFRLRQQRDERQGAMTRRAAWGSTSDIAVMPIFSSPLRDSLTTFLSSN